MKRGVNINAWLQPLATTPVQAYLTNELQVADVLEWALQQMGRSEVWQTSFSISEEFLRRLYFINKSGLVKRFNLVLDHKATNKTVKLWSFINQVITQTYLADNHSKILLVKNDKGNVLTVVTSQNLTRGNRHESAVLLTSPAVFNTLHGQMMQIINNKSVPLHELFGQRLAAD